MKGSLLIRFWVVIGILALGGSVSGALSVDEQVKKLAARYAQVEDQLARSVRYASRDDKGYSEHAWFNGADDLIKLAVESHDGGVRKLISRSISTTTTTVFLCLCARKRRAPMAVRGWKSRANILAKEKEVETV